MKKKTRRNQTTYENDIHGEVLAFKRSKTPESVNAKKLARTGGLSTVAVPQHEVIVISDSEDSLSEDSEATATTTNDMNDEDAETRKEM